MISINIERDVSADDFRRLLPAENHYEPLYMFDEISDDQLRELLGRFKCAAPENDSGYGEYCFSGTGEANL